MTWTQELLREANVSLEVSRGVAGVLDMISCNDAQSGAFEGGFPEAAWEGRVEKRQACLKD